MAHRDRILHGQAVKLDRIESLDRTYPVKKYSRPKEQWPYFSMVWIPLSYTPVVFAVEAEYFTSEVKS